MKMIRERHYRLFDHTADLGMEFFGDDALALFTHAGRALFEVMVSWEGQTAEMLHPHDVVVEGEDWADLMVNWLRELLYLFNGRRQLLQQLHIISLFPTELRATVTTEDFVEGRHRVNQEIKAVTYHQVAVEQNGDGWRARVVFDV
jgi:SHS2 domain-containing protein